MEQADSLEASASPSSSTVSSSSSSPSLEDLMKLLKGKTDSQRLAGLLLVTKLCDKNDQRTILDVYHALGSTFLHRLLLTGMGKGAGGGDNSNRHAYLRLSVTLLAAFARVSQLAATDEMVSRIPLILEVISNESGSSFLEECYEFLFLITSAREDGVITLYDSGGMKILSSQLPTLPDGSQTMELAMKLVQLIVSKLPAGKVHVDHPSELSNMVVAIAKQFALVQNALKFDALHLLCAILSSSYSGALHVVLQSITCGDWSPCIRVGVMDVLQNRVAPAEKLQALVLAECAISIAGEEWLIGPTILPFAHNSFPDNRCILLVLESSRVEIAVILNELAFLKYEASKTSPPNAETFLVKLRNLGVVFSLVERIVKHISKFEENEESNSTCILSESSSCTKVIRGLNETIGVVLDYLQDAKDHGDRKGDDLLASVRIVGSYLAEAPSACKEKVKELFGYMLSVEGEDASSPFHSISFLLPMLCQITMENDGCEVFASAGTFRAVVGCLISLIHSSHSKIEDSSTTFLACDIILNLLLKKEQMRFSLENSCSVKLLQALSRWTEDTVDPSVIMMASSICSLILDTTSEEALLRHPDFKPGNLVTLSQLMKRSLVTFGQDLMADEADLYQIVSSGYSSWADRFPHVKQVIER